MYPSEKLRAPTASSMRQPGAVAIGGKEAPKATTAADEMSHRVVGAPRPAEVMQNLSQSIGVESQK